MKKLRSEGTGHLNHMPKTTLEASLLTPSFQMLISHVGILDLHRGSTVYCLCSIEQSHEPGSDSTASSIKWGMRELKGSEEVTWRLVPVHTHLSIFIHLSALFSPTQRSYHMSFSFHLTAPCSHFYVFHPVYATWLCRAWHPNMVVSGTCHHQPVQGLEGNKARFAIVWCSYSKKCRLRASPARIMAFSRSTEFTSSRLLPAPFME